MRIAAPASVVLLTASLLAQVPTNPIAYPADTVRAGAGNLAPFGLSTTNTFDDTRWQQLIPAKYLPSTGAVMMGLLVNCQSSNASVTYTSLQITLSHTTATTLGNSFSGNLPNPVLVFSGSNHPIQWAINRWVGINFTLPFPYNGTDNLVVSIQKSYDRVTNPVPGIVTHQTSGSPSRSDLGQTKYAGTIFGGGGFTTDTATFTGSAPLSMRLNCIVQGTTTVASVTQILSREFALTTNMIMTVWATSGSPWLTFVDTSFRAPLTFPGIGGSLLVRPNIMFATGATSGGSSALTVPIPNDPSLVGAYLVLQTAVVDPTLTNISFTNAVDLFVNSNV